MQVVAETVLDVLGEDTKLSVRIFKPEYDPEYDAWSCQFEIGEPIGVSSCVRGLDSLQAIVLTLKMVSTYLYSSKLYKERRLGIGGEFGGNLFVPAPKELLDIAPYPF